MRASTPVLVNPDGSVLRFQGQHSHCVEVMDVYGFWQAPGHLEAAGISTAARLQGCTHFAMALQMMLPQSPPCSTPTRATLQSVSRRICLCTTSLLRPAAAVQVCQQPYMETPAGLSDWLRGTHKGRLASAQSTTGNTTIKAVAAALAVADQLDDEFYLPQ